MHIKLKIFIILLVSTSFVFAQKSNMTRSRLNILSGEKEANFDAKFQWDQRYSRRSYVYGKLPAKFLAENFHYLNGAVSVLDMGMGEGRNAIFIAQKGHQVTGIDISSVAIKKARKLAKDNGVRINAIVGTLNKYVIPEESFDAIVSFYYVDRELKDKIYSWLKPGGILIYEAHTLREFKEQKKKAEFKKYFLAEQELLTMFPRMKVLKYEEPNHEKHHRASIILQKRKLK